MPIDRRYRFLVPQKVGHGAAVDTSCVPDFEAAVVTCSCEQLADARTPTQHIHIATVRILDMNGRLFPVRFSNIPYPRARICAGGGENRSNTIPRTLPLDILNRRSVTFERILGVDIPTSFHWRPQHDQSIIASRQKRSSLSWIEVQSEAFLAVCIASKYRLRIYGRLVARLLQRFSCFLQVPHVHLARVCPSRDNVARLWHTSYSVHTTGMRHGSSFNMSLRLFIAIAFIFIVLVTVFSTIFVSFSQVRPLHQVNTIVGRLLRLCASNDICGHWEGSSLCSQVVTHDVEAQTWPTDVRSMQHCVRPRFDVELFSSLQLVDARSPHALWGFLFLLLFLAIAVDNLFLLIVVICLIFFIVI
mmetsp:Transcript_121464/g.189644  ORF Transcript_121464/g.189644 Transcript_121464/m.189644 type:complete len:360 (-) Transcript_121464:184-1263(-)